MTLVSRLFAFLGALPRPVRVSAYLFFAASLADGVLMPFFAIWAVREAGVPVAAVGLLLGCYAAGELVATPVVGGLSDRLGRRPVLILSTLGVGLGFLILYRSHGTLAAAAALLTIGLFENVLHPTAMAVVADVVPPAELRSHYGLNRMASSVGSVIGPALGSLLVLWSLSAVFLAASMTLLSATIVVALGLRETHVSGAQGEDDDEITALGAVFRDRRLAAILAPLAVIQIATSWIEAVLPLAATQGGALTLSGVGWLFAYAGLVEVIFQMPVLRLCKDTAGSRMVMIAGTILVLAFGALAFVPGLPGFILAATGFAFADILISPMVQAVVMEIASEEARGTYSAALSVVSDLKDAAGPALGTPLFALAAGLPWLVGLGLTIVATSGLAFGLRRHEART
ncbi:MAG: MFS transporter [Janthinobacterium lividum]